MRLINETDLKLDLEDLLNREWWEVEHRTLGTLKIKPAKPLNDWTVKVSWLKGTQPYYGYYEPSKKLIMIKLNPNDALIRLLLEDKARFDRQVAVGTEQLDPITYRYKFENVAFLSANDLVRWIFCHEFSHVLDYLQGFSLRMKQTKANRFALRHYYKGHAPAQGKRCPTVSAKFSAGGPNNKKEVKKMEDLKKLELVEAVKRIRRELRREFFQGTTFKVRSRRFSGGEAIDIEYTDGPATEKVEKIAKQYDDVSRDPLTGDILLGGNRYVHVHRKYSDETLERVKSEVKARFADGTFGEWDQDPRYRMEVWRTLAETDFRTTI